MKLWHSLLKEYFTCHLSNFQMHHIVHFVVWVVLKLHSEECSNYKWMVITKKTTNCNQHFVKWEPKIRFLWFRHALFVWKKNRLTHSHTSTKAMTTRKKCCINYNGKAAFFMPYPSHQRFPALRHLIHRSTVHPAPLRYIIRGWMKSFSQLIFHPHHGTRRTMMLFFGAIRKFSFLGILHSKE